MNAVNQKGGFAVLRHRDFALYLAARLCSAFASQMIVIAVGWQVYHMTGRLLDLGLIGLSQFLPFLLLALYAGHAADRHDRRLILMLCASAQLICAALLLGFAAAAIAHTWTIFAVLALLGVARAFQMPAAQSLGPNLVPPAALGSAIAVSSSSFQLATIAGPSVGGLLYALADRAHVWGGGAALVYGAAVLLLLPAIAMYARLGPRRSTGTRTEVSWSTLLEGLNFVWRRKTVLGAMSLDLFAVLFGGAAALLPAYTKDVLHAGPEVFGLLRTAPGLGAGTTALILAARPIRQAVGLKMFLGVAVFGGATVVLGVTRDFRIALAALIVMGAADMISVFVRTVLVQTEAPDSIRGRVSAVNSVFIGASNELGEFESGLTAAWLGLVPAIIAGGAVTLAVSALWAWVLFPGLRRLRSFEQLK